MFCLLYVWPRIWLQLISPYSGERSHNQHQQRLFPDIPPILSICLWHLQRITQNLLSVIHGHALSLFTLLFFCIVVVRERYENLRTKSLPDNFFTNMFVQVCNNMHQFVETQLPWETLLICINPRWPPNI